MSRSVLILDDDQDLRDTLGEVMHAACNVECVTVPDVESMIRSGERALHCSLAILDINLGHGQPSGLDAQAWLTDHGFIGHIVLLTGHAASHPLVRQAMALGTVQILQKPISASKLCALVEEAPQ